MPFESFRHLIGQARDFRRKTGRPFVTVSYAQSLDGSIASAGREQMRLSGPESMRLTHELRACCQSILVGIGTVLADDPSLTVRLARGDNPQPIVLDTRLRTPPDAKLLRRSDLSTWLVNADRSPIGRNRAFERNGATLIRCKQDPQGLIDLFELMEILDRRRIDSLMVEGGARVITSFVKMKLVDRFVITVSPRLIGGLPVIDTLSFKGAAHIQLAEVSYQNLGGDMVVWARPEWSA